jgi:hypothetical protein
VPIDGERPASDGPAGVRPAPITGHHAPLDGFPERVIVCDVSRTLKAQPLRTPIDTRARPWRH